ncbi:MAG: capsule assembly Wzi family protein [bacterium]
MKQHNFFFLVLSILINTVLIQANNHAFFWTPNTYSERYLLHYLNDQNIIKIDINSYPIDLTVLRDAYQNINQNDLNFDQKKAVNKLKKIVHQPHNNLGNIEIQHKSQDFFTYFLNATQVNNRLKINLPKSYKKYHANLSLNIQKDWNNKKELAYDNSYIIRKIKKWAIGYGSFEQSWGPSWESSLNLSTNAKPFPHVFIHKNTPSSFKNKYLSKLGPWTIRTFLGKLEKERATPSPFFHGMRINFFPHPTLTLGLSRIAMFGGGNRKVDAQTFINMFFGRDNVLPNNSLSKENEPGNQNASIDFRWQFTVNQKKHALYSQWTGEDFKNGLYPFKFIRTHGLEGKHKNYNYFLEFSNTLCKSSYLGFGPHPGVAYNHPIYPNGYTYYNKSLGHTIKGDSQIFSLGIIYPKQEGEYRLITRYIQKNLLLSDRSVEKEHLTLTIGTSKKIGLLILDADITINRYYYPFSLRNDQTDRPGGYTAILNLKLRKSF